MMKRIHLVIAVYFLIVYPGQCFALGKNKTRKRPETILVMLQAEQNRIEYFKNKKDNKYLECIVKDANKIVAATINDFNDNFKFCPVYYFFDTDMEKIKMKKFDGVVFRTDKNLSKKYINENNIKNYLIVYYGRPSAHIDPAYKGSNHDDPHEPRLLYDTSFYENYTGDDPECKGLIINDAEFNQVSYVCKLVYWKLFVTGALNKKYYYVSKKFDIEYLPLAKKLGEKFAK